MNFYLDEHLPPLLAQMLQERGIDCLTTQAARNTGRTDEEQLSYAADRVRVFLTFNRKDFLFLAKDCARIAQHRKDTLITKSSGCRITRMRHASNSVQQPVDLLLSSFDTLQILLLLSVGYGFSLNLNSIGTRTT
jgi:predicted nuclease of predicted toxin-antitoxin system